MRVVPVPCLSDNYAYVVARAGSPDAIVIDPSEAEPVARALAHEGLELTAILATHHHHDHVGGVEALRARFGAVAVYAHASDAGRVPGQSERVEDGRRFTVAGLEVLPLHVPGHTRGAVAYVVGDAVFTGDTLFVAGCGRLFEGTADDLHASLNGKLARLPITTRVYCGHEYTAANLRFAAAMEPESEPVREKAARVEALRAKGEPTVPSTIADELETNPFLRVGSAALRARFPEAASDAERFAAVRRAKDAFRG
jgi:hydroxyacylglutathione hydrolase